MDRSDSSETVVMPLVSEETFCPFIESFLTRITAEQWALLRSGTPDAATKLILADMLLDIIAVVIKVVLRDLRGQNVFVSEECVQSCLSSALSQGFAEVLDVIDQVQCVSSERLSLLIGKEVTEGVNSALSTNMASAEPSLSHATPPRKLNKMVLHACKMLKEFAANMKVCKCAPPSTGSQTASMQTIISKEVNAFTEPLLLEVPHADSELLQAESTLEIQSFSENIVQSSLKEIESLKATECSGPSPKSQQRHKRPLKGLKTKIKNFFAKRFVGVSIRRIVAQLRTKFHQEPKVESRESVQSLVASIDSLLMTEDGEKQKGGNEVSALQRFKDLSPDTVLVFTKELSDLLYSHLTDGAAPEIIPQPIQVHANMYLDIQSKVVCFLALISWWLNTQAARHSHRVALALMGIGPLAASQLPEEKAPLAAAALVCEETRAEPVQDARAQAEKNKMSVRVLVEKLVTRTFKKAKVIFTKDSEAIIQNLFEKTWAEVERTNFHITPDTVHSLDKIIFKELCKRWSNAEMVLISMRLREPELETCVASSFKRNLTAPKQPNAFSRLFSSVRKGVSNIFRRRNNVMVI